MYVLYVQKTELFGTYEVELTTAGGMKPEKKVGAAADSRLSSDATMKKVWSYVYSKRIYTLSRIPHHTMRRKC